VNALEELLERPFRGWKFEGAALAGVRDAVVWRRGDAARRFDVASLSKTLAATAAQRLALDGVLRLSDPAVRYLPRLPYADVTLEHLLRHTSGLFDLYADAPLRADFLRFFGTPGRPYSNADYLSFLRERRPPPDAAPGTAFRYSNTNYVLLGLVLEAASGERYDRLLARLILEPCKMAATEVLGPWAPPPGPEGEPRGVTYGDDDVLSTLEDLFLFARALAGGRLLPPETLEEARRPGVLPGGALAPYGRGLQLRELDGALYAFHTGGTAGVRCLLKLPGPDDPLTLALLADSVPPDEVFKEFHPAFVRAARSVFGRRP
jgi:D-alanyl-D-alanine carboxypeptidase